MGVSHLIDGGRPVTERACGQVSVSYLLAFWQEGKPSLPEPAVPGIRRLRL